MKELQLIQTELKAPKGKYNSFGKYAYRSCEDILNSRRKPARKNETKQEQLPKKQPKEDVDPYPEE